MMSQDELNAMGLENLEAEIKSRRELMATMVGTLYPSIITDEITQLRERLLYLKKVRDNV